jgi:hypothetical protein
MVTCISKSFEKLKKSFISALVLHYFNPERIILIKTDAFNLIIMGVLSQYDNNGIHHPVVYFSKKHSPTEIDHEIYDKELLMIIYAFKE